MAIHPELPIYKVSYDLLSEVVALVKNMPREFKQSIGGTIRDECIAITTLVFRANVSRDNAALLEENARLKRHAEAMAEELRTLPFAERVMNGTPNRWWQSLEAYRADFPKEAP